MDFNSDFSNQAPDHVTSDPHKELREELVSLADDVKKEMTPIAWEALTTLNIDTKNTGRIADGLVEIIAPNEKIRTTMDTEELLEIKDNLESYFHVLKYDDPSEILELIDEEVVNEILENKHVDFPTEEMPAAPGLH